MTLVLLAGLTMLDRFGLIHRASPWDWFHRTSKEGYATRVTGVVDAVSIDNESVCITPNGGEQLCGDLRMAQAVPLKGQRVIAYYSFVPEDSTGDVRSLVWVATYSVEKVS